MVYRHLAYPHSLGCCCTASPISASGVASVGSLNSRPCCQSCGIPVALRVELYQVWCANVENAALPTLIPSEALTPSLCAQDRATMLSTSLSPWRPGDFSDPCIAGQPWPRLRKDCLHQACCVPGPSTSVFCLPFHHHPQYAFIIPTFQIRKQGLRNIT